MKRKNSSQPVALIVKILVEYIELLRLICPGFNLKRRSDLNGIKLIFKLRKLRTKALNVPCDRRKIFQQGGELAFR